MAAPPTTFHWAPLESNPEIFTAYMQKIGLPDEFGFSEVYGFDEELLTFIPGPVLGVIANLEHLKRAEARVRGDASIEVPFYMKQSGTLDNACGIIAALHAVCNNLETIQGVKPGSILERHLATTAGQSPEEKCTSLEENKEFQEAHREKAAEGGSRQAEQQSDVKHHYVAFVLTPDGKLLELDGTKVGPLVCAENCTDVLRGTVDVIKERLAAGEYSEVMSLMTLGPSTI